MNEVKKIRPHGYHWWLGISNELDCNGRRLMIPRWQPVHCWTCDGGGFAIGAHFTAPMKQRDMGGVWGAELIPTMVDEEPVQESRSNGVAGRRCDRSNAEIEQACLVMIDNELDKGEFRDTTLIGLMADVVRLTREYSDAMNQQTPTGTEASVCLDITRRQQIGIKKYGQSVRDNPLPLQQWLQHAYEETLDNAVYLKRAMEELQSKVNAPQQ